MTPRHKLYTECASRLTKSWIMFHMFVKTTSLTSISSIPCRKLKKLEQSPSLKDFRQKFNETNGKLPCKPSRTRFNVFNHAANLS